MAASLGTLRASGRLHSLPEAFEHPRVLGTLARGLSACCVPDLSEALGLEHSKVPVARQHCREPRGHRGGGRCPPVSAPARRAARPVLGWGKGRGGSPDVLGSPCVPGLTGPPSPPRAELCAHRESLFPCRGHPRARARGGLGWGRRPGLPCPALVSGVAPACLARCLRAGLCRGRVSGGPSPDPTPRPPPALGDLGVLGRPG